MADATHTPLDLDERKQLGDVLKEALDLSALRTAIGRVIAPGAWLNRDGFMVPQTTADAALATADQILNLPAILRLIAERRHFEEALLTLDPDWFMRGETPCAYPACGCDDDASCHVALNDVQAAAGRRLTLRLLAALNEWFLQQAPEHYRGIGLHSDVEAAIAKAEGQS